MIYRFRDADPEMKEIQSNHTISRTDLHYKLSKYSSGKSYVHPAFYYNLKIKKDLIADKMLQLVPDSLYYHLQMTFDMENCISLVNWYMW